MRSNQSDMIISLLKILEESNFHVKQEMTARHIHISMSFMMPNSSSNINENLVNR